VLLAFGCPQPILLRASVLDCGGKRSATPLFEHTKLFGGSLAGVDGIMSRRQQQSAEARWQMRIHKEFHARARCRLRNCSERLANSMQANKSSRSKSGNSASTSSIESPAARYSRIDSTGYRNPRITGLPWQISGSIVTRDSSEFIFKKIAQEMSAGKPALGQRVYPIASQLFALLALVPLCFGRNGASILEGSANGRDR